MTQPVPDPMIDEPCEAGDLRPVGEAPRFTRRPGARRRLCGGMTASLLLHTVPVVLALWSCPLQLLGAKSEGGSGWACAAEITFPGDETLAPGADAPVPPPLNPPEETQKPEQVETVDAEPARPDLTDVVSPDAQHPAMAVVAGGGESGPVQGEGASLGSVGEVPAAVWNPKPAYPNRARRAGWEGFVEAELTVTSDGVVQDVRLLKSSGKDLLDTAALDALRMWRFAPTSRVVTRFVQRVTFTLKA